LGNDARFENGAAFDADWYVICRYLCEGERKKGFEMTLFYLSDSPARFNRVSLNSTDSVS
jgi:hypothetical protein